MSTWLNRIDQGSDPQRGVTFDGPLSLVLWWEQYNAIPGFRKAGKPDNIQRQILGYRMLSCER